MEFFIKIIGYENYEVSNFGNVRRNGKMLKLITKNGYNSVGLCVNGKSNVKYVHRLVAEAFVIKVENKNIINHKDGNRKNNNVNNLEWCTYSENIKHSFEELGRKSVGVKGEKNGMYKFRGNNNKNSKPVICINTGIEYGSRKEAARELGINAGNITNICNGIRNKIKGYSFKWK